MSPPSWQLLISHQLYTIIRFVYEIPAHINHMRITLTIGTVLDRPPLIGINSYFDLQCFLCLYINKK